MTFAICASGYFRDFLPPFPTLHLDVVRHLDIRVLPKWNGYGLIAYRTLERLDPMKVAGRKRRRPTRWCNTIVFRRIVLFALMVGGLEMLSTVTLDVY
jgi:hypothetical protein